jgi:hypothetical protein
MLLLLALMQTVDADEVVTARRLFARPECRRQLSGEEIRVCGARDSDRLVRPAARPDPRTIDRRPKIRIGERLCLQVGFTMSLSAC